MLVDDIKEITIKDICEVKIGKFFTTSDDSSEFSTARICLQFMTQDDFESGCGLRHQDSILKIYSEAKEKVHYKDKLFNRLLYIDNYLITDRAPTFELTRIILPTFALKFKNTNNLIKIEAFATFFHSGYFSITYRYMDINKVMSCQLIQDIKFWNNVEYIFFDKLLSDKLRLEYENVKHINSNFGDSDDDTNENPLYGIEFNALSKYGLLNHKINFMLEFLMTYILEDNEPTFNYSLYNTDYTYYYLQDTKNSSFNKSYFNKINNNLRKIIEGRPKFYEFNNLVNESLNDISISSAEKLVFTNKYLISVLSNMRKGKYQNFILENRMDVFSEIYATIEFFLIERSKIIDIIKKLKNIPLENLNAYKLYEIKNNLMDLQIETNTYNFMLIDGDRLSSLIRRTLKINDLYDELNIIYKKVENKIDEESTKQKDRNNLLIQFLSLLISIPSISTIIDLISDIILGNKANLKILSLTKLVFVIVSSIVILRLLRKQNNEINHYNYNKPKTLKAIYWLLLMEVCFICLIILIIYLFYI